ncbi:lactonase family protein [Trinickia caryophylli]
MTPSFLKTMWSRYGASAVVTAMALWAAMQSLDNRAAALSKDSAEFVYIGTQDRRIHVLRFDTSTGELAEIGPAAEGPRSTWVTAHPRLPMLYAVDDDNSKQGSVTAYAVNRETGALARIDEVETGGSGTTNLYLDVPSATLLAANYGGGSVASIALNDEGGLGPRISTIKETGSGPNRRQASAHAHSAVVDPSGRYVLVPDLGADRVFVYGFDRATHRLLPDDHKPARSFVAPPGSGPRHIAFGSSGQFAYLLTELSAQVMTFRWDASEGRLTLVQTLPITRAQFDGVKSGAGIAVSRDGRFLYVEDRGEDALVVFRIDEASGELSPVQRIASGGEKPWGFALDPSGRWMLVANQRSGRVNVFGIDPVSGRLSDTGHWADVVTPVSVAFMK